MQFIISRGHSEKGLLPMISIMKCEQLQPDLDPPME